MNRSSIKKAVPKSFAIFTEKHLCWSLFLNKDSGLQSWNFVKKRLQQRCFSVNIAKFLRGTCFEEYLWTAVWTFSTWANKRTSNESNRKWRRHLLKNKTKKTILKLSYNLGHNILRLFDALPNFPFTTSETNRDY